MCAPVCQPVFQRSALISTALEIPKYSQHTHTVACRMPSISESAKRKPLVHQVCQETFADARACLTKYLCIINVCVWREMLTHQGTSVCVCVSVYVQYKHEADANQTQASSGSHRCWCCVYFGTIHYIGRPFAVRPTDRLTDDDVRRDAARQQQKPPTQRARLPIACLPSGQRNSITNV